MISEWLLGGWVVGWGRPRSPWGSGSSSVHHYGLPGDERGKNQEV